MSGRVAMRPSRWGMGVAAVLVVGVVLGGCQKKSDTLSADPLSTSSTAAADGAAVPSFKKTEQLAKQWEANPADVSVAMAYAANLEALNQRPTQLGVLKTTADHNASNADVQVTMGKKLLAAGDGQNAAELLERAAALKPADWQVLSALGTAYDQQLKHPEAREKYEAALAIRPGEISVLNNLAMSYALQGKLAEAEKTLRDAMARPGASAQPRVRQNLALVVGLQGRFDESKRIASEDLPPDEVQANLAYLQQMLSRPNTWAQLQDNG